MAESYYSLAKQKVRQKVGAAKQKVGRKVGAAKQKVKSGIERGAGKATLFFVKPLAVVGVGYLLWIKTANQRESIVEPWDGEDV